MNIYVVTYMDHDCNTILVVEIEGRFKFVCRKVATEPMPEGTGQVSIMIKAE
jgi:hypothetical protein